MPETVEHGLLLADGQTTVGCICGSDLVVYVGPVVVVCRLSGEVL